MVQTSPCFAHAFKLRDKKSLCFWHYQSLTKGKISLVAEPKAYVCVCSEALLLAWSGSEWMLDACAHFILIMPQMSRLEIDWVFWEACQLNSQELCRSIFVWQLKTNKPWKHCFIFIMYYVNATSDRLFLRCLPHCE